VPAFGRELDQTTGEILQIEPIVGKNLRSQRAAVRKTGSFRAPMRNLLVNKFIARYRI